MSRYQLALPPNIVRKALGEIQSRFPSVALSPPQTHDEMSYFFKHEFGDPEKTADLTVTAYPSALARAKEHSSAFQTLPADLPPMRCELSRAGLLECAPYYKVIGVVTLMIIHHRSVEPPPRKWADLCRPDLVDSVVIPPESTPAPAIYGCYMDKFCGVDGAVAASRVNAKLLPQDINKSVDAGDYKAGMVFPAFARTFRTGMAKAVWPEEGAVAIPLIAFVKKRASEAAVETLRYLCSEPFQRLLAVDGLFCPMLASVPLFDEMMANKSRIAWLGWEDYIQLGK
ncbi:MAG: hypothetical protein CSA22_03590 [Deltaproteobacteria bacterium]|nr:MAG: hypothetical protein CSA22_03590 [Deltaproteobacteria bacterium]